MVALLIATRNAHKVEEIQAILGARFRYLTLHDFPGAPAVIEDADTFAGNATKKSVRLARWMSESRPDAEGLPATFVLADDSGLEVDALKGAPGVHSARFAALNGGTPGNAPDAENILKLLRLLKEVPMEKRTARFRCVLALTPLVRSAQQVTSPVCSADEFEFQTEQFEGTCEGTIALAPRGQGGFGYDPLFTPVNYEETFAELNPAVKNRLSHRAKALAALRARLATITGG